MQTESVEGRLAGEDGVLALQEGPKKKGNEGWERGRQGRETEERGG